MPKTLNGTVWLIEQAHRADRKYIQCALDGVVKSEGLEPLPDDLEAYHLHWDRVSTKLIKEFT